MPLIILIHVSVYYTLHGSITEPETATQKYCAQTACMVYSLQTAGKYVIFIW
jgi:hypothetical protein